LEVVESLREKQVIFVPDTNLASWVERQTSKKLIKWGGYCQVHDCIKADIIKKAMQEHPRARVVAHPECRLEVLDLADKVTGTGGMIEYARKNAAKEFIIVTEEGMVNRLKKEVPGKKFFAAAGECAGMKKVTLLSVKQALEKNQFQVTVDEQVRVKAKKALDRMLEVK
jgi:quinolinate synthase